MQKSIKVHLTDYTFLHAPSEFSELERLLDEEVLSHDRLHKFPSTISFSPECFAKLMKIRPLNSSRLTQPYSKQILRGNQWKPWWAHPTPDSKNAPLSGVITSALAIKFPTWLRVWASSSPCDVAFSRLYAAISSFPSSFSGSRDPAKWAEFQSYPPCGNSRRQLTKAQPRIVVS